MKENLVLEKKYHPESIESSKYDFWMKNNYFKADPNRKKPKFSLVLPPPNVTGKLHLGHAWDGSLQDALVRFKKLTGYETLYLPGMDHAGIATQTKVEAKLKETGTDRFRLGREAFLAKTWSWKEDYAQVIRAQWKKLGLGLDYSQEKFTLDPQVNDLVRWVFVQMYHQDLIYQGEQIVNWDPEQETAISNVEVIYQEVAGKMYYFKYRFQNKPDQYLVVATTRPETMFADQAVVVNPSDTRYQTLIGQMVINPVNQEAIPLLADDYVTADFGTGAMKVTPAHDPNDFVIGQRHHLKMPKCLTTKGLINEMGGPTYEGLDALSARKKIVANLTKDDNVVKVEDITHQVGFSERTQAVVEPYLSKQWFVRMQPLAAMVLDLQTHDKAVEFFPPRFKEVLNKWMENVHDWTISRQLWWGHQIPVWYHNQTKEVYVGVNPPDDVKNYTQDPDVLDTWFSSGLWPLATLNWNPDQTEQNAYFKAFFPTSTLVTGYDIIFFWVARMIFQSLALVEEKPFNDVLIHGLIRDETGKKMSKSLGNGIDPMDIINQYGADALRFFLLTNSTPGQDIKYSEEKIRSAWNFINKLWNASRFVLMNIDQDFVLVDDFTTLIQQNLTKTHQWILQKLQQLKTRVINQLNDYEFALSGRELLTFVWDDYCSWFIELSKVELEHNDGTTKQVLVYVLKEILILLHPFIPFVSEEIYQHLGLKKSILEEQLILEEYVGETSYLDLLIALIEGIRDFRAEKQLKKDLALTGKLTKLTAFQETLLLTNLDEINAYLQRMVNFEINQTLNFTQQEITSLRIKNFFIELDATTFFDYEQELNDLLTQQEELKTELVRSEKILTNPNFVKKAAREKVALEQSKYQEYQLQAKNIATKIAELKMRKN